MLLHSKRMRLFWIAFSLVTIVAFLLVACERTPSAPVQPSPTPQAKPSPTPSPTSIAVAHVNILGKNGKYGFEPATLKIRMGTQVIWTNDSDTIHTVTSDTLIFNIDSLGTHQVFTVIFSKPGTYPYYCNIHTSMIGTIIVTP